MFFFSSFSLKKLWHFLLILFYTLLKIKLYIISPGDIMAYSRPLLGVTITQSSALSFGKNIFIKNGQKWPGVCLGGSNKQNINFPENVP